MSKQYGPHSALLLCKIVHPAVPHSGSFSTILRATDISGTARPVEVKYLYFLVEREESEMFYRSKICIKSYNNGKNGALLLYKQSFMASAASASCKLEHQVCLYSEKWCYPFATGLKDS